MGGGRTEVHLEMEFLNHEELSRPDKGKRITCGGTFYEADMDLDVIISYDVMGSTDTGDKRPKVPGPSTKTTVCPGCAPTLHLKRAIWHMRSANSFAAPYGRSSHAKGPSTNMVLLPKPSERRVPD